MRSLASKVIKNRVNAPTATDWSDKASDVRVESDHTASECLKPNGTLLDLRSCRVSALKSVAEAGRGSKGDGGTLENCPEEIDSLERAGDMEREFRRESGTSTGTSISWPKGEAPLLRRTSVSAASTMAILGETSSAMEEIGKPEASTFAKLSLRVTGGFNIERLELLAVLAGGETGGGGENTLDLRLDPLVEERFITACCI